MIATKFSDEKVKGFGMGMSRETQPLLGQTRNVDGAKFNQYLAAISGMDEVEVSGKQRSYQKF